MRRVIDLTEPQESTEEVQEKITSGNIIKLSWTGRLENSDKIVDQADNTVIVVGKSNVIPGIDEILLEMRPGEPKTVNIPPERGYGKRDPSQMQITSIRKFKKQKINPQPGMNFQSISMMITSRFSYQEMRIFYSKKKSNSSNLLLLAKLRHIWMTFPPSNS